MCAELIDYAYAIYTPRNCVIKMWRWVLTSTAPPVYAYIFYINNLIFFIFSFNFIIDASEQPDE